jgi:hypothetical protein
MPRKGTTSQRGYGTQHRHTRAWWAPRVATGTTTCARCGQPIRPGQPWDLGHTDDRKRYAGPEHANCNRSAGARTRGHATPDTEPTPPAHGAPLEADEW